MIRRGRAFALGGLAALVVAYLLFSPYTPTSDLAYRFGFDAVAVALGWAEVLILALVWVLGIFAALPLAIAALIARRAEKLHLSDVLYQIVIIILLPWLVCLSGPISLLLQP